MKPIVAAGRILFSLVVGFAASISPGWAAPRPFVSTETFKAFKSGRFECRRDLTLIVQAAPASAFTTQAGELQRLLGGARVALNAECPALPPEILVFYGVTPDEKEAALRLSRLRQSDERYPPQQRLTPQQIDEVMNKFVGMPVYFAVARASEGWVLTPEPEKNFPHLFARFGTAGYYDQDAAEAEKRRKAAKAEANAAYEKAQLEKRFAALSPEMRPYGLAAPLYEDDRYIFASTDPFGQCNKTMKNPTARYGVILKGANENTRIGAAIDAAFIRSTLYPIMKRHCQTDAYFTFIHVPGWFVTWSGSDPKKIMALRVGSSEANQKMAQAPAGGVTIFKIRDRGGPTPDGSAQAYFDDFGPVLPDESLSQARKRWVLDIAKAQQRLDRPKAAEARIASARGQRDVFSTVMLSNPYAIFPGLGQLSEAMVEREKDKPALILRLLHAGDFDAVELTKSGRNEFSPADAEYRTGNALADAFYGSDAAARTASRRARYEGLIAQYALVKMLLVGSCGSQTTTVEKKVTNYTEWVNGYGAVVNRVPSSTSTIRMVVPTAFGDVLRRSSALEVDRALKAGLSRLVKDAGGCNSDILRTLERNMIAYQTWRPFE